MTSHAVAGLLLMLASLLLPGTSVARKPLCKVSQVECVEAKERCIANSAKTLQCRPGKEAKCRKAANRQCTKQIRRCCRKTPLETCCGGAAFGTTTTTLTGGGGGTTTTTTSVNGSTTTTLPQACTSSADCTGFACCNVAQGLCCVLGSGSAACTGSVLAGTAGCTSNDGIDFPPTPVECGPSRPPTCPTEAVSPVGYQCHICSDGKIMQSLYNTQTGERTLLQ
jgi:hypothetical protein